MAALQPVAAALNYVRRKVIRGLRNKVKPNKEFRLQAILLQRYLRCTEQVCGDQYDNNDEEIEIYSGAADRPVEFAGIR
jgi:hypothetical protein